MPATPSLSFRDFLFALAVIVVWGTNFSVIRVGLDHLPPLLFAALRFTFAVLPAMFFVAPPEVPWRKLAAYGLLIGPGQFGLLFIAMNGDITPGLASIVVQMQSFFTIALAAAIARERVQLFQVAALAIAAAGIAVILTHTDGQTTPYGLALVLVAALNWGLANIVTRSTPNANMLSYVVWASIFSAPPLFAMSFALEGWAAIRDGLANANFAAWATVAYQSFANTLFGFAMWGWLLSHYPAATVAPLSLLIPIVGMTTATIWLGEPMQPWKLLAAALVISGVCINLLWPKFAAIRARRHPPAA